MKEFIKRLRYKIALIIKPKQVSTIKLGKIGTVKFTEGSSLIRFKLFNNKVTATVSLQDFIKVCR